MRTHVQRGRAFENLQRGCFESDSSEEHEGVSTESNFKSRQWFYTSMQFLDQHKNFFL